ncbi:GtrA family protein [Neobacillus muris]|uniref:GtrA family protein n=1 Tax=Neobacillus muris TaxID=2941334 RepID=UPI00203C3809|nr:GtrA family protein [Neobacillus muris]
MKNIKEMISYIIFGVLTTLVNIVCYAVLAKFFNIDYKIATSIAWLISVIFAFVTNKIFVFNSKDMGFKVLVKELLSFLFFRLLSYGIDLGMMIVLVEWIAMDDMLAKILANIVVVIINFFASKFLIFKSVQQSK